MGVVLAACAACALAAVVIAGVGLAGIGEVAGGGWGSGAAGGGGTGGSAGAAGGTGSARAAGRDASADVAVGTSADGRVVVTDGEGTSYVAGELLAGLDPGVDIEGLEAELADAGIEVASVEIVSEQAAAGEGAGEGDATVALVTLAEGGDTDVACEQLQAADGITYVEPNYVYTLADADAGGEAALAEAALADAGTAFTALTDDPREDEQWEHEAIGLSDAWGISRANGTVTVAVIDSGIDYDHPDLAANLVDASYARNTATDATGATAVEDSNGHGSHVAGIIAAVADNAIGIAGSSYNAKVLPVKATHVSFGPGGWSDRGQIYVSDIVEALDYVTSLKTDASSPDELKNLCVVSMSLFGTSVSRSYEEAVGRAQEAGLLVVAAVGNDATDEVSYPAAYDGVLGVSALKADDSGAGVVFDSSYSNYGSCVDISAPGTSILSTYRQGLYTRMSGTSMAAPVVAAAAALVFAADARLDAGDVTNLLEGTSLDLGDAGRDDLYGYGALQIGDALERWQLLYGTTGLVTDGTGLMYSNGDGTYARSALKVVDGKRYYFDAGGYACTGLVQVGSDWYYFDEDCVGVEGKVEIDGKSYYFDDATGARVQGGFIKLDRATGARVTDDAVSADTYDVYYYRTSGEMVTGLARIYGYYRYFGSDGVRRYGAQEVVWANVVNDEVSSDGVGIHSDGLVHEMMFDDSGAKPSGIMRSGFVKLYKDGSGCVSSEDAAAMVDDSAYDVCYYRINGEKLYGLAKIYGVFRYLDVETGVRCYGRQSVVWADVVNDDGTHADGLAHEMYFDDAGLKPTGIMKAGEFVTCADGVRYYRLSGEMATGALCVYGNWCYFDADGLLQ